MRLVKFVKKTNKQNPLKNVRYIMCYRLSGPTSIKISSILSDTTIRRSAVDHGDLRHTDNGHTSQSHQQTDYLKVFQML